MKTGRPLRSLLAATALAGVTACAAPSPIVPAPTPAPRPVRPPAPEKPSLESHSAKAFYERRQTDLLARGYMRRDGGGADARVDATTLARNFERIALFSEYMQVDGRYVARQNQAELRRWERPVRLQIHFGKSVDPAIQAADRTRIEQYVARLSRISGHPISVVGSRGNFHLFVGNTDEQRDLGPRISAAEPGLTRATVHEITRLDRSIYCAVYASSSTDAPDSYVSAIAFVRAEHPDLFRLACYHEEIAQGLGLPNDSPAVRPSIFNDDEEFALLTYHDELLLRILYDERLRVGMTAEEARPIVRQIARELVGEPGPV
ncbi:hypothetical protein JSE7799_03819 [Jannaschia seosinensis]|uniref:DUF2927 domain-containing protein n=1 Tax=Jannaschia seosinensis TaxID=313367 RepID=A0A0M7BI91_9RHOB|nr:DUF2927 domain-containing protein [Jannaschia seosinensis]CUH41076.1 hypothetical protein JSE7799_03819 [Jannaschia seosinensis]